MHHYELPLHFIQLREGLGYDLIKQSLECLLQTCPPKTTIPLCHCTSIDQSSIMAQNNGMLQHKYTIFSSAKSTQIICDCNSSKLFHNNLVSELLIWQTQQQYFLFRTSLMDVTHSNHLLPVPISLHTLLLALQFDASLAKAALRN